MRRKFHRHASGELGLESRAMLFELGHYTIGFLRSEHADKNMGALQIGFDVDVINSDKRAFKTDFTRNDSAELPFHNFVEPQHSMFHKALSFPIKVFGRSLRAGSTRWCRLRDTR